MDVVSILLAPYDDWYLLFTPEVGASEQAYRHHLNFHGYRELGTETKPRNGVWCQFCNLVQKGIKLLLELL